HREVHLIKTASPNITLPNGEKRIILAHEGAARRKPRIQPLMKKSAAASALTLMMMSAIASSSAAQKVTYRELRIPMSEAGPEGLEGLLVYPDEPGKHPLALISHGSPRSAGERPRMSLFK